MNEVHKDMRNTAVRQQRYESALNEVSNALDVQNLSVQWIQYRNHLRPEVLDAIGWCADTLPAEEEVIDSDDLSRFQDEVGQFEDRIAGSDLPDYVKSFVLQQVSIIEQAIREYPITGARAFGRGYVNSFVNAAENRDTFVERQNEEEMQELRSLWSQMQKFAHKAAPWVAIGQAVAKFFELTSGGG